MCNIAENIIVKRVAHILNSMKGLSTEDDDKRKYLTYYGGRETSYLRNINSVFETLPTDVSFDLTRRLEDVLTLLFAGSKLKRFLVVNTEDKEKLAMPIFLLEVFEPSHAFVPIYLTDESILVVSPFHNTLMENRISGNPYICELMPTPLMETDTKLDAVGIQAMLERKIGIKAMAEDDRGDYIGVITTGRRYSGTDIETSNDIESTTIGEFIYHTVCTFASGIMNQDQILARSLGAETSGILMEVTQDSNIYNKIKKVYGTEAIDKVESENNDPIICVTDYMPIYLTYKSDSDEVSGFAVMTTEVEDGKSKTIISVNSSMLGLGGDKSKVSAIITKDNIRYGVNYAVDLGPFYYVGDNKVIMMTSDMVVSDPIDLFSEFAIPDNSPLAKLEDEIGTEAFDGLKKVFGMTGDSLKGFWFVVRRFGVKQGTNFFIMLGKLFAGLKDGAKWLVKTFTSTFKRGIDLEKDESLEFQERVLNDELDEMEERFRMYGQVYFRSLALSIATGGLFAFPISWLIAKHRTKKAKVKAIERVERRIDDAIERLERKMNYAEERSENESVDSILREIQLYRAAKQRVLDFKRDSLRTDRIKYVTYDKDLGLTTQQKLEQHINNGGTY